MGQQHADKPAIVPDWGYIDDIPYSSKLGLPAQQIYQHLRTWRFRGSFWMDSHPPDDAITYPDSGGGAYTCNYYVILYAPPRLDSGYRQIAAAGLLWGAGDPNRSTGIRSVKWKQPADTGAHRNDIVITNYAKGENKSANVGYGDQTQLFAWTETYWTEGFDWDADAVSTANGFSYGRFQTDNMYACLTFFECPDSIPTEEIIKAHPRYFAPGEIIRGYEVDTDVAEGDPHTELTMPSVGHLIHHVGDGWEDRDMVEQSTRRCLFQWGHPVGIWCNSSSSENLFGAAHSYPGQFQAVPRNLRNLSAATTIECLPSLVVTAHAGLPEGSTITYTSLTTNDTWTYTVLGTESATLITPEDGVGGTTSHGLMVRAGGELIEITYDLIAGSEILVHTVSLWEGPAWASGEYPVTDPNVGGGGA